jgi:guanylate kinase
MGSPKRGWVFVLSSPSGGGKTTVVQRLLRRVHGVVRSVSATTRPRRLGERHGRDYWFFSAARFAQLRRHGQLLEWANVHGAWYGTLKAPILRRLSQGRDTILNIDVQGARSVRRLLGSRAVLIFLLPPSLEVLRKRLQRRRTESHEDIRQRMAAARHELRCARWYDYAVVNDRLKDAVQQLEAILMAHRCRTKR